MKITLRNIISKYSLEYDSIFELIKKYDRIIIFRHIRPDFDALGSQLGLSTYLKKNFPDKEIYTLGDNHGNFTGSLYPKMDSLTDSFLNEKPFLAIILDVSKKSRIADPRFEKASDIVRLDHHPEDDKFGTVTLVNPLLSSACEFVASIMIYLTRKYHLRFPRISAGYLYSGIVGDSGRFLYASTSPFTFEVSDFLLKRGIKIAKIYAKMYDKELADLTFTKFILNNFHLNKKGICYYILTEKDLKLLNITTAEGKDKLGLFSGFKKIKIWVSITEDNSEDEPCFRVSIRSKEVDISNVATKYEGGGHAQASGAKLHSLDEVDNLISDLEALL